MNFGETSRLGEGRTTLQIGGVLLLVQPIVTTREFEANLDDELETVLQIDRVGAKYIIRVAGTPIHFSPRPAGALARLAATPGTTVSQSELLQAADPAYGGGNPTQLVTYVRNAIRDGIRAGNVDAEQIRAAVGEACSLDPAALLEPKTLLKHMFENVRGAGYRLNLPAASVAVTRS
ncbi:MAG: DNA-binding response OmpR family regulator [Bradymonadia bacterium]|jgi:DNA-binding response OmpR family regulator